MVYCSTTCQHWKDGRPTPHFLTRVVGILAVGSAIVVGGSSSSSTTTSVCGRAVSLSECDAMLATPVLPVFVRMHKVGSTTLSLFLECVRSRSSLMNSQLGPWLRSCNLTQAAAAAERAIGKTGGNKKTESCCKLLGIFDSWSGPWSHRIMSRYLRGELRDITTACLMPAQPHRYITMLRDPKELFWSVLNFFGPSLLHGATEQVRIRVARDPESATSADIRLLARDIDGAMNPANGIRQYTTVLGGARAERDHSGVKTMRLRSNSNISLPLLLERSRLQLARDFLVGLTADFSSSLALLGLEFSWPAKSLCLPLAHTRRKDELLLQNFQAPRQDSTSLTLTLVKELQQEGGNPKRHDHYQRFYSAEVDQTLNKVLAAEIAIYQAAFEIHAAQIKRHGSAFTALQRELDSPAFQADCAARRHFANPGSTKSDAQAHQTHAGKDSDFRSNCLRFDVGLDG